MLAESHRGKRYKHKKGLALLKHSSLGFRMVKPDEGESGERKGGSLTLSLSGA